MQAPGVTAPNGLFWHCPSVYLQRSASRIPGGGAAEGQTPSPQPKGAALKPPAVITQPVPLGPEKESMYTC